MFVPESRIIRGSLVELDYLLAGNACDACGLHVRRPFIRLELRLPFDFVQGLLGASFLVDFNRLRRCCRSTRIHDIHGRYFAVGMAYFHGVCPVLVTQWQLWHLLPHVMEGPLHALFPTGQGGCQSVVWFAFTTPFLLLGDRTGSITIHRDPCLVREADTPLSTTDDSRAIGHATIWLTFFRTKKKKKHQTVALRKEKTLDRGLTPPCYDCCNRPLLCLVPPSHSLKGQVPFLGSPPASREGDNLRT